LRSVTVAQEMRHYLAQRSVTFFDAKWLALMQIGSLSPTFLAPSDVFDQSRAIVVGVKRYSDRS
jgi:hypothetical protein